MEESIRIRRASEPLELVKLVRSIFSHRCNYLSISVFWAIASLAFLLWKLKLKFLWGQKVKVIKEEISRGEEVVQLPGPLKQKITDEILVRLKSLNGSANITQQQGGCTLISPKFWLLVIKDLFTLLKHFIGDVINYGYMCFFEAINILRCEWCSYILRCE